MNIIMPQFFPTTVDRFKRLLNIIYMTDKEQFHAQYLATYLVEQKALEEKDLEKLKSKRHAKQKDIKDLERDIKRFNRHIEDLGKWCSKHGLRVAWE